MAGIQYDMKNVLDIPLWERMQDQLAKMTGTAIICIDYKGNPMTKHSGRTEFAALYARTPFRASAVTAAMHWPDLRRCGWSGRTSISATVG